MNPRDGRAQIRKLAPLILLTTTVPVIVVAVSLLLIGIRDEPTTNLFSDVYELTGSRLSGLVSMIGVVLLAATAAICVFVARITWTFPGPDRWSRYLLGAGLVTGLLALDDYLSIHELADDVLAAATGVEAGRPLKNVLEAGVLGIYALLLALLLWRFRSRVVVSEWVLLAIAGGLLMASLALDLAPHSWLASTVGMSFDAQAVVEDTLKLVGIAFYAAYFTRASAQAVRSASQS